MVDPLWFFSPTVPDQLSFLQHSLFNLKASDYFLHHVHFMSLASDRAGEPFYNCGPEGLQAAEGHITHELVDSFSSLY
jgi:hypothetical protein